MPFVRFKRWRYLAPLAPHVAICGSGRRYVWTGADEGEVSVLYKADVEWLLNPPGEGESLYELAYERHGIAFDAAGKEIDLTMTSPGPDAIAPQEKSEDPTPAHRGPGRPKRR